MKLVLIEDKLKSEINQLNIEIQELEASIGDDENEIKELLKNISVEEQVLQEKLNKANDDLKFAVKDYYNQHKLSSYITSILTAIEDKFRSKYKYWLYPYL
jgi:predicted  nucleic acid-binding Zn-ribbon protein